MLSVKEEEEILRAFGLKDKRGGTYVEIGALDGQTLSNTLYLSSCLDWRGVLVEAERENALRLFRNVKTQGRPNVTAYFGAVCAPPQRSISFLSTAGAIAVGGDVSSMGQDFRSHWHGSGGHITEVPCQPMHAFLEEPLSLAGHVDFFSLDVEGAELVVLETINFDLVTIDIMIIEFDRKGQVSDKNMKIMQHMVRVGFAICRDIILRKSVVFVRRSSSLLQREEVAAACSPYSSVSQELLDNVTDWGKHHTTFRFVRKPGNVSMTERDLERVARLWRENMTASFQSNGAGERQGDMMDTKRQQLEQLLTDKQRESQEAMRSRNVDRIKAIAVQKRMILQALNKITARAYNMEIDVPPETKKGSTLEVTLPSGRTMQLQVTKNYPNGGKVKVGK